MKKQEVEEKQKKPRKKRAVRPFPACSFKEALEFASSIFEYGSGQAVRRLSLFDHLGKSPDSSTSRMLITNSGKYGLTKGGYQAEHIELTSEGIRAVDDELPQREVYKARIKLGIQDIEPFFKLFEKFSGNKLPAKTALIDAIKEFEVDESFADEAVDTFIVNLRDLNLLQTLSGSERIVTIEHLLDSLPATSSGIKSEFSPPDTNKQGQMITQEQANFENTCFYITPIGEEDSEFRKHADLFLGSIVEPALEESFGLKVVRADTIDKPGVITRQIIDYIMRSRLVVADLSFHNPNVFYELAIRHAARLPVVQIIRKADKIPFDLNQVRTISIDTTDIYSLVPKINIYKSEIANQARRVLEDPDAVDNPITTYYPSFKLDSNS